MDEALLDELYSAPLDGFIPRRTALAKELRGGGRRDEAAEVAGLRKPTVPVWTANQLARRNRPGVEALLAAGAALRSAIGEGDRDAFAAAQREQSDALRRLRDAARRLLDDPTDATLERAVATLRAASIDEELRPVLEAGRLAEEPEPGGFDTLAGLTFSARPRERAEPKPKRTRDTGRQERLKRARAALREAKAAHRQLEREAERARKAAEKAAESVAELEAEVDAISKGG